MTPQTLSVTIFPVLFGMVIVWFVLNKLLFNRLERDHPQNYEAMGRPSLFLRNSIAGGWATLKVLVAREHKALNDSLCPSFQTPCSASSQSTFLYSWACFSWSPGKLLRPSYAFKPQRLNLGVKLCLKVIEPMIFAALNDPCRLSEPMFGRATYYLRTKQVLGAQGKEL